MAKIKTTRIEFLQHQVDQQRAWIASHGGTLEAYIERYGVPGAFGCIGDGGVAIYQADTDALAQMELALSKARSRQAKTKFFRALGR